MSAMQGGERKQQQVVPTMFFACVENRKQIFHCAGGDAKKIYISGK
jgi:hypothetical protein